MFEIYRGRTLFSSDICLILYVPWVCKIKTEKKWSMRLTMNEAWMKLIMIVNGRTASVESLGRVQSSRKGRIWGGSKWDITKHNWMQVFWAREKQWCLDLTKLVTWRQDDLEKQRAYISGIWQILTHYFQRLPSHIQPFRNILLSVYLCGLFFLNFDTCCVFSLSFLILKT